MHLSPANFIPLSLALCYVPPIENSRKKERISRNDRQYCNDRGPPGHSGTTRTTISRPLLSLAIRITEMRTDCSNLRDILFARATTKKTRSLACINARTWSRESTEETRGRVQVQTCAHVLRILGILKPWSDIAFKSCSHVTRSLLFPFVSPGRDRSSRSVGKSGGVTTFLSLQGVKRVKRERTPLKRRPKVCDYSNDHDSSFLTKSERRLRWISARRGHRILSKVEQGESTGSGCQKFADKM